MAMYSVKSESLTAVADAIRAKTGGADLLAFPDGMVEAIEGISGGGGGLAEVETKAGGVSSPGIGAVLNFDLATLTAEIVFSAKEGES